MALSQIGSMFWVPGVGQNTGVPLGFTHCRGPAAGSWDARSQQAGEEA